MPAAPTPWSDLPAPPCPALPPQPSAEAPLAGLTFLLVEDSRFASDALRLVVQRAGGRLRRAETLALARRHLGTYRPDAVIVDLGLPDGRGEDLIAELACLGGPPALAISGDDDGLARARRAGAAAFLAKPLGGMAAICRALLALLPGRGHLAALLAERAPGAADPLALRDDLAAAARWLAQPGGEEGRRYLAGFVSGLARSSHDPALEAAANAMRSGPGRCGPLARALAERLERGALAAPLAI